MAGAGDGAAATSFGVVARAPRPVADGSLTAGVAGEVPRGALFVAGSAPAVATIDEAAAVFDAGGVGTAADGVDDPGGAGNGESVGVGDVAGGVGAAVVVPAGVDGPRNAAIASMATPTATITSSAASAAR